jgi:DNA-binding transcriptional LysR family regulator
MGNDPANPLEKFRQLRLKSQQIMLLAALDEHRNLRRAATAIHTTQPAATASLQQLEERLGVSLFDRKPRGMLPTAFGEAMIRYARGVLHDFGHAIEEIDALASGASGLLRVGSVMGAVPALLTDALNRFHESNPKVKLSILVETSDLLVPALIRGELDIALGRLPDGFHGDNLSIEPLEAEPMCVIGRPGHPMLRKRKLAIGDLLRCRWVLHPAGSPMRRRVDQAFRTAGIAAVPDILETASILATTSLLTKTDALSVVPEHVARHYAGFGMLAILPVALPITMDKLGLITRSDRNNSAALSAFVATVKSKHRKAAARA